MFQTKAENFAGAYSAVVEEVIDYPKFQTAPRGKKIKEIIGAQIVITDPSKNLFTNPIRSIPLGYLADELCLYFSGTYDPSKFGLASKFWDTVVEDGKINSAYGNLIFSMEDTPNQLSQWAWAVESLVKDLDSRQALMHFNRPQHQYEGNKDFPCTVSCQWFIRESELHLITYMRSNDVFFGMTFDVPFFLLLMQAMQLSLAGRGIEVFLGEYTHFVGSLHAYEKDFETLDKMLNYSFSSTQTPLIDKCPIFHPDLDLIIEGENPHSNSNFIQWLFENSTFKNKI